MKATAEIVSKIRDIRKSKNISQKEMGEALGIEQQSYNRLELGDADVTISQVEKIAERLGLTFYELVSPKTSIILHIDNSPDSQNGNLNTKIYQGNEAHIKDLQQEVARLWDMMRVLGEKVGK